MDKLKQMKEAVFVTVLLLSFRNGFNGTCIQRKLQALAAKRVQDNLMAGIELINEHNELLKELGKAYRVSIGAGYRKAEAVAYFKVANLYLELAELQELMPKAKGFVDLMIKETEGA